MTYFLYGLIIVLFMAFILAYLYARKHDQRLKNLLVVLFFMSISVISSIFENPFITLISAIIFLILAVRFTFKY